jgi:hypothetical protein
MQSSRVVNKIKESELSINRKAASTLRKKLSAIDPAPPLDIEESYLEFSIKAKRETKPTKPSEVSLKRDVFMTPNNKIYNAKQEPVRAQREELRPRSSNTDKYQKSIEIHSVADPKQEVRPGSSKSSRLFKKKSSTLGGDEMQGDNVEDDSFIKVTTRERDPGATLQRQRIGTSMSKKNRGGLEKFQSKLDPEFFNLFAS